MNIQKLDLQYFIEINAMILFIYCSYELYKLIQNYVEIAREIFSSKQFMVSNAIPYEIKLRIF